MLGPFVARGTVSALSAAAFIGSALAASLEDRIAADFHDPDRRIQSRET